eukprot:4196149-Amphidinium_carterae.1
MNACTKATRRGFDMGDSAIASLSFCEECLSLKSSLMEIEENGTGRVPLDVFYQGLGTNITSATCIA